MSVSRSLEEEQAGVAYVNWNKNVNKDCSAGRE